MLHTRPARRLIFEPSSKLLFPSASIFRGRYFELVPEEMAYTDGVLRHARGAKMREEVGRIANGLRALRGPAWLRSITPPARW